MESEWVGAEERPADVLRLLHEALDPSLADLARTTGLTLTVDLRRESDDGHFVRCTLFPPSKSWDEFEVEILHRESVSFEPSDSPAQRVVEAARAVARLAIDEHWAATGSGGWPMCSGHTHPLEPAVVGDSAVWQCPSGSNHVLVGSLDSPAD